MWAWPLITLLVGIGLGVPIGYVLFAPLPPEPELPPRARVYMLRGQLVSPRSRS